jgi:hypothetical protein
MTKVRKGREGGREEGKPKQPGRPGNLWQVQDPCRQSLRAIHEAVRMNKRCTGDPRMLEMLSGDRPRERPLDCSWEDHRGGLAQALWGPEHPITYPEGQTWS